MLQICVILEATFLKVCQKNPQHDCVKLRGGGGSRAVYTMCKKTSNLVADGFPYVGGVGVYGAV